LEIVFLSTEAVPFAKTGGLGDVCGALPMTLAARGHRVTLILPAFRSIWASGLRIVPTNLSFAVPIRGRIVGARLLRAELPVAELPVAADIDRQGAAGIEGQGAAGIDRQGTAENKGQAPERRTAIPAGKSLSVPDPVTVYFIDQPEYYDRHGLYGDEAGDFADNCERFAFFCRAALQSITRLERPIDIVHCHDWQTGLVPAYMRMGFESPPWMAAARSVFTIHNLAYQGRFWHWDFPLLGVEWDYFKPDWLEYYGEINFLKIGIQHADTLTTVSPTYAEEIQNPLHGCGLDPLLRSRSGVLRGITNGIDDSIWNPATDPHLRFPQAGADGVRGTAAHGNYDVDSWREGKSLQKRHLQETMGLAVDEAVPMIGLVGRLADQKGWDLVLRVLRWHLEQSRPTQWMILGTGETRFHQALAELQDMYPGRFGLQLGFSDQMAHRIEAAADLFVMPSRYEPCGLNQIYSLRYGTVPIVMSTGGLVDTVVDATHETIADGTATGFRMRDFSAEELDRRIGQALEIRYHQQNIWAQMVETGMRQDWSWRQIALQYERLYADTVAVPKLPPAGGTPRTELSR